MMKTLTEQCGRPPRRGLNITARSLLLLSASALVTGAFAFDVELATSFDRNFPDKWTHTPSGTVPFISNRDTVYAGMPLRIHVFFKDFARDYSGHADLIMSYKIAKPDGSLFFDTSGIPAVSGLVPNKTALQLSYRIPGVTFTGKDTPGNYTLTVSVEDRISRFKQTKAKRIIVANYPKVSAGDFDDMSFNVWVHGYCLDPDPGRAIPAFTYFINSKMSDDNGIFWPVFYFFQCLFHDNPALVRKLAAAMPKSSTRLREYTVFLLRAIQCTRSDVGYPVPDSLWRKFDHVAATGFYDPFTDAFLLRSNKLMEFAFYYHGNYSMVRFLIECLGVNTPAGYAAFLGNCSSYGGECAKSLDTETARQFAIDAKSILAKTFSKHPLVKSYCTFALENEALDIDAKNALLEIVAASKK